MKQSPENSWSPHLPSGMGTQAMQFLNSGQISDAKNQAEMAQKNTNTSKCKILIKQQTKLSSIFRESHEGIKVKY